MNILQDLGCTIATETIALALWRVKDSICRKPALQKMVIKKGFSVQQKGGTTKKQEDDGVLDGLGASMQMLSVQVEVTIRPNTIGYALQHGGYIDKKQARSIERQPCLTANQIYPTPYFGQ